MQLEETMQVFLFKINTFMVFDVCRFCIKSGDMSKSGPAILLPG